MRDRVCETLNVYVGRPAVAATSDRALAGCFGVSLAVSTEVFWTCPRCVMVLLCRSFATFIRCTADMFQTTGRNQEHAGRRAGGSVGREEGGSPPSVETMSRCRRIYARPVSVLLGKSVRIKR